MIVPSSVRMKGLKSTMIDKDLGYELRCAPPIPFDAESQTPQELTLAALDMARRSGAALHAERIPRSRHAKRQRAASAIFVA